MDDETNKRCTDIVKGFHEKIHAWWNDVENEKRDTNGRVHVLEKLWRTEDTVAWAILPIP